MTVWLGGLRSDAGRVRLRIDCGRLCGGVCYCGFLVLDWVQGKSGPVQVTARQEGPTPLELGTFVLSE